MSTLARAVHRPATVAETADLLRTTTGSVLVRGAGTKQDWAGPVPDPDLVLDTTALRGVLTHNPADQTVAVRAGTPLAELQDELAGARQWLALDPPSARDGATVGGLLAAGDSGPSRLRYGGLRDLVIGVTVVLADGTVAHAGGHVIKNVAGYDLAKLLYGSLGSLAVLTEVVLRLHPLPAAAATLSGSADAATAAAGAAALAAGPEEPAAVEWVGEGGNGRLLVRVDASPAALPAAAAAVSDALGHAGIAATTLGDADAAAAWAELAAAVRGQASDTVVRVAALPTDLPGLAGRVRAMDSGAGVALAASAALGLCVVRVRGDGADRHAAVVQGVRDWAAEHGTATQLRRRAPGLDQVVDPLGPPPGTLPLLRAVKARLDPAGRLAPGRFAPWY